MDFFGFTLALIGLVTVFLVLSTIAIVISLFRHLDEALEKRKAEPLPSTPPKAPGIDALTLVIISSAVATVVEGEYAIKRIQRVPSIKDAQTWSRRGRAELQSSHVIAKSNQ